MTVRQLRGKLYLRCSLQAKDYYKILELPPSATLNEIKSAYRRLAHQFHPDKNNNDPYAVAQFEIIKEAYEVLSNPTRKDQYLQQRWYDQVMYKKQTGATVTPVTVLKQMLELDKYVAKLDVHRMDKEGLYNYICYILSDETIQKLNGFNEQDINRSIVESALNSSRALTSKHIKPLAERLVKLDIDNHSLEKIRLHLHNCLRSEAWNRYKKGLIVLIVLLLCWLIYAFGS